MATGRKTGGRKKGSLNKATADVKALAQVYSREAVDTLASIMRKSESDTARVAAVKEILDRGYGKAGQPLTSSDGGPLSVQIVRLS